jgi:hypothetical protein
MLCRVRYERLLHGDQKPRQSKADLPGTLAMVLTGHA